LSNAQLSVAFRKNLCLVSKEDDVTVDCCVFIPVFINRDNTGR